MKIGSESDLLAVASEQILERNEVNSSFISFLRAMKSPQSFWKLDDRTNRTVFPEERLSWRSTVLMGMQHVVAIFGSNMIIPLLVGIDPSTSIFFTGIGTILFFFVTFGRLPSYLGCSSAFVAPIVGAHMPVREALGGVFVVGVSLMIVGAAVTKFGIRWIEKMMPPIVTGSIVLLIGLNLAPLAINLFREAPGPAAVALFVSAVVSTVPGLFGRLSVLIGVVAGSIVYAVHLGIDFGHVSEAAWLGSPNFQFPVFTANGVLNNWPVVIVLVAENVGHIKAVSTLIGRSLDHTIGSALFGDGLASTVSGSLGGLGCTTYAQNIGVMASTRVFSTAPYLVAGLISILLGSCPKFGAIVRCIPMSVIGGVCVMLYGSIAVVGAKIWVEHKVDFSKNVNLVTAGISAVFGATNFTVNLGQVAFGGIVTGSVSAIVCFQVLSFLTAFMERMQARREEGGQQLLDERS